LRGRTGGQLPDQKGTGAMDQQRGFPKFFGKKPKMIYWKRKKGEGITWGKKSGGGGGPRGREKGVCIFQITKKKRDLLPGR